MVGGFGLLPKWEGGSRGWRAIVPTLFHNVLMVFVFIGLALGRCGAVESPWKAGWAYGTKYSSPLLIDVNGDGTKDVVLLCDDGWLRGFDGSDA
jgi:hypothetical protein